MPWRIVLVAAAVLGLIASPTSPPVPTTRTASPRDPRGRDGEPTGPPSVSGATTWRSLAPRSSESPSRSTTTSGSRIEAIGNQGNEARQKIADPLPATPLRRGSDGGRDCTRIRALGGHPILARRAGRAGISVMTAAVVAVGLKTVFGRFRPARVPGRSVPLRTVLRTRLVSFGSCDPRAASAVALDRETTSGWCRGSPTRWRRWWRGRASTTSSIGPATVAGAAIRRVDGVERRELPRGPGAGECRTRRRRHVAAGRAARRRDGTGGHESLPDGEDPPDRGAWRVSKQAA